MGFDVTIVGGGIVGCAVARELARYRLRVLLIEAQAEASFGTTKANSGIIHAGHHGDPTTLKGRLEWPGNRAWHALASELGVGLAPVGELMVAFDASEVEVLRTHWARGRAKGVTGLAWWGPERIRREEPNLSHDVVAALHAPTAAVLDPYEACFALLENAMANGVEAWLGEPVLALTPSDAGLRVRTARREVETRFVVNAAGLFADDVAALAGAEPFVLRARKGEEYLLDARLAGFVRHVIFPCPTATSKGVLIIPTLDGTLMVGPTARDAAKDDLANSTEGAAEVFAKVQRLAPALDAGACIGAFAGLRAVAEGEDFVVGPTRVRGFLNAAGIQSPGLTAAPVLAARVAELLEAEGLELEPNDRFDPVRPAPVRFADLAPDARAELAQRDPRHGRLVCRCEEVTEGDVRVAVQRGARTLDGVKFRTRAGMGRCQGGFCTWPCLEILADELGVPVPALSKRGGASWLVRSRPEDAHA